MPYFKDKIVILGADHNGVELKQRIKEHLTNKGFYCIDIGPNEADGKVDYVDYAKVLSGIIDRHEAGWGVLICGTGVGMSMTANRFNNVRAALVHDIETAPKTREHNNANVLCLGAWTNPPEVNLAIADAWFAEPFGEGRHVPRVAKLSVEKEGKVVFTNGIFDILHTGHLKLFKFAQSLGDRLVVGINSDRSTKMLKGPGRPINNESTRKEIISSLEYVDEVVIFDDTKTLDIITQLRPDIVVKGGEWTADEVRSRDKIPAEIDVKVFPMVAGFSTTNVIKSIKESQHPAEYDQWSYDRTVAGGTKIAKINNSAGEGITYE